MRRAGAVFVLLLVAAGLALAAAAAFAGTVGQVGNIGALMTPDNDGQPITPPVPRDAIVTEDNQPLQTEDGQDILEE
jgi:hypothetical protein